MNRIAVNVTFDDAAAGITGPVPKWGRALGRFSRRVLDKLGRDKWDISVLLCDDTTIGRLNRRYRGKAGPTDILSFAMEGGNFPNPTKRQSGDIAISLDTLKENALRFGISEDEELRRLLIHGILHLNGMNHKSNSNTEPMLRLQERILSELGGQKILPVTGLLSGIGRT